MEQTHSIAEVSQMFGVTEVTVYLWIKTGKLKADVIQKGMRKNYRIHEEVIQSFMNEYPVKKVQNRKAE